MWLTEIRLHTSRRVALSRRPAQACHATLLMGHGGVSSAGMTNDSVSEPWIRSPGVRRRSLGVPTARFPRRYCGRACNFGMQRLVGERRYAVLVLARYAHLGQADTWRWPLTGRRPRRRAFPFCRSVRSHALSTRGHQPLLRALRCAVPNVTRGRRRGRTALTAAGSSALRSPATGRAAAPT